MNVQGFIQAMPRAAAWFSVLHCLSVAVLLSFTGLAAAKPIPLSQPFDMQGKRIVVVAAMGHMAAVSRQRKELLGAVVTSRQQFFRLPASVDLDPVVAREAAAELESLGAQTQVVALSYRDDDLYDVEVLERAGKSWTFDYKRRDAWALDLLRKHAADALLFVHSGEKYTSDYTPPIRNYGVSISLDGQPLSSYVFMIEALYVRDRTPPLVLRGATGRAPLPDLQLPAATGGDAAEPVFDAGHWEAARPSLELAAGRVARALVQDLRVRAMTMRASATETRRIKPPVREGVEFWFAG